MADAQKASFQNRLKTIDKGGPNTNGQVLVGPQDDTDGKKKKTRAPRQPINVGRFFSDLFTAPFAAILGAIAMLGGRVASFHMYQPGGAFPVELSLLDLGPLLADVLIGATLAVLLLWIFKVRRHLPRVGVLAGFIAVMVAEPAAVERFPDVFQAMYSDTYISAELVTSLTPDA
jgi:hypothetical protein